MPTPLEYAAAGWRIFPCHTIVNGTCSCYLGAACENPGKHPRVVNGSKDGTTNPHIIQAWMGQFPDTNWALTCGVDSDVFAVDLDPRKGGYESFDAWEMARRDSLPTTRMANTGGGGRHLLFKYPQGIKVKNRVGMMEGVDVRSDNGYIILPDGKHISGGSYSWINWDQPLAEAPDDLIAKINGGGLGGGDAESRLEDTDSILDGVPEGKRDDTLFRFACRLRRQLGDKAKNAVEILVLQAAAAATPPFDPEAAKAKVDQAWKQDHSDPTESGDQPDAEGDDPVYRLTDMGNRDRFVQAYGNDLRYVDGLGWFGWTDIGWVKVADVSVMRKVEIVPSMVREEGARLNDPQRRTAFARWAHDSEMTSRINAIEKLAKSHEDVLRKPDDFDNHDDEIACRNGMLSLRTGQIRPFNKDDLFTKNTGIVYDPDFKLAAWENFLEEATQGDQEMQRYLQMSVGYTLTGSIAEECFFMVSGPPASGKSTFLDAITSALGSYAVTTGSDTFMYRRGKDAPREEVVRFAGARAVVTSEIKEGDYFDDAFVKRITGGDAVTARLLYQESFEFTPRFKLWIGTNHDPVSTDSALFRRVKRIMFTHTVPPERRDRTLKALLKDPEMGGKAVLAWAIKGAMEYYRIGRLIEPTSVTASVMEYQADQDSFTQFMNESFLRNDGAQLQLADGYRVYTSWCAQSGERPVRRAQFVQRMKDRGYPRLYDGSGAPYFSGLAAKTVYAGSPMY